MSGWQSGWRMCCGGPGHDRGAETSGAAGAVAKLPRRGIVQDGLGAWLRPEAMRKIFGVYARKVTTAGHSDAQWPRERVV